MTTVKYTEDHEWLRIEADGSVTVGITAFAQDQLGDLVYVQLPEVGKELKQGEEAAVIESVKTAGEITMPANGTVIEVNPTLADAPETVNLDPMGAGWFFKIKTDQTDQLNSLMDEAAYNAFVANLG